MTKFTYFIILLCIGAKSAKKYNNEEKPAWAKKDIRDFSDADMERYFLFVSSHSFKVI